MWRDSRGEEQLYVETVVHRNIVYVYPFLYFLALRSSLRLFMIKLRAECYVFKFKRMNIIDLDNVIQIGGTLCIFFLDFFTMIIGVRVYYSF